MQCVLSDAPKVGIMQGRGEEWPQDRLFDQANTNLEIIDCMLVARAIF